MYIYVFLDTTKLLVCTNIRGIWHFLIVLNRCLVGKVGRGDDDYSSWYILLPTSTDISVRCTHFNSGLFWYAAPRRNHPKHVAHRGPTKNVNKKHVSASRLPYLAPPLFDSSRCYREAFLVTHSAGTETTPQVSHGFLGSFAAAHTAWGRTRVVSRYFLY